MLSQRPSARSLLNHPFIQSAGSKSVLVPLIERFTRYKAGKTKSSPPRPIPTISDAGDTIVRDGWEYETIVAGPSQANSLISSSRYSATSRGVGDGYLEDDLEDERERFRTVQVREVEGNEVGPGSSHVQQPLTHARQPLPDLLPSSRNGSNVDLPQVRTPELSPTAFASDASSVASGTIRPAAPRPQHERQTASEAVGVFSRARAQNQDAKETTIIEEVVVPALIAVSSACFSAADVEADPCTSI